MVKPLLAELDEKMIVAMNAAYARKIAGDFEAAEKLYLSAWALYPEPQYDWDSSQITLYALADFYLEWGKYSLALEWAEKVLHTSVAPGDGSPWAVIGKIHFEAGQLDVAYQNFHKAYSMGKRRVFQGEDKKYLAFYLAGPPEK